MCIPCSAQVDWSWFLVPLNHVLGWDSLPNVGHCTMAALGLLDLLTLCGTSVESRALRHSNEVRYVWYGLHMVKPGCRVLKDWIYCKLSYIYVSFLTVRAPRHYRKVPNSNNLWVWINRSILGGFGRGLVWINRYIRTGGMVVCTGTTRSVVRTVRIVRTVRTTIRTAYRTYCTYCTYCTYQL